MGFKLATKVKSIGPCAMDFLEDGLLVLFGEEVPETIGDYCYIIGPHTLCGAIEPGDVMSIDDAKYVVSVVGGCANENYENLGHVTLGFGDPSKEEVLGGAIGLRGGALFGSPKAGSKIEVATAKARSKAVQVNMPADADDSSVNRLNVYPLAKKDGGEDMAEKTTLKDIADEVGVSISAVSRVLNGGTGRISQEKRKLILKVAERRHYLPNQIARSLVAGKSRSFGLILPSIESRTYTALTQSLEEMCRVRGYGLFITNSSDKPEMDVELVNLLVERGVDAIFIVPSNEAGVTTALSDRLDELPIPFVMVGRYIANYACDRVYYDNELGGYLATKHLVEMGHKRIACVANTETSNTGRARFRGYVKALEEAHLSPEPETVLSARYTMKSGYDAGLKLLNTDATAAFAGSDYIALGIRKAFLESGLIVPDDLSLIAFDQSESDFLFEPQMTAMIQDMGVLAFYALSIVSERMEGRGGADPVEIVLPPDLKLGGSVRALGKHMTPPPSQKSGSN